MKRVINLMLIIISAFSLVLALKYSSAPIFPFLPAFLKDFFITTNEAQQEYVLVYDFSIGFLLSALFYFIVEEIPEKVRLFRAKKLLSHQVNSLLEQMEVIIRLVLLKYNRTSDIDSLTEKDFLILNGDVLTPSEEISYHRDIYYNNGERKTGIHELSTLNKIVKSNIERMLECTAYIKDYEYLYAANIEFMECIRNIENCELIRLYEKDKKKANDCFLYANSSAAMEAFIKLYRDLKKARFHTEYSVTSLDPLETTQKYHEDMTSGRLISQVIRFQQEKHERSVNNRVLVISGNKYYTQILVKELQRNIEVDYINLKEFSSDKVKGYKFIVAIIDDNTFENFKNIFGKLDTICQVILVSERVLFSRNYKRKFDISKTINIIEEIEYKCIKKIRSTHLFINRAEPSAHTILEIAKRIESITIGEVKLELD